MALFAKKTWLRKSHVLFALRIMSFHKNSERCDWEPKRCKSVSLSAGVRKIYSWKLGEKGKEIVSLSSEKVGSADAGRGECERENGRWRRASAPALWMCGVRLQPVLRVRRRNAGLAWKQWAKRRTADPGAARAPRASGGSRRLRSAVRRRRRSGTGCRGAAVHAARRQRIRLWLVVGLCVGTVSLWLSGWLLCYVLVSGR